MRASRGAVALEMALTAVLLTAAAASAQSARFLDRPPAYWLDQLSRSEAQARRSAAFALGQLGPAAAAAVPALVRALADSDPRVADAAAFALGQIGPAA